MAAAAQRPRSPALRGRDAFPREPPLKLHKIRGDLGSSQTIVSDPFANQGVALARIVQTVENAVDLGDLGLHLMGHSKVLFPVSFHRGGQASRRDNRRAPARIAIPPERQPYSRWLCSLAPLKRTFGIYAGRYVSGARRRFTALQHRFRTEPFRTERFSISKRPGRFQNGKTACSTHEFRYLQNPAGKRKPARPEAALQSLNCGSTLAEIYVFYGGANGRLRIREMPRFLAAMDKRTA